MADVKNTKKTKTAEQPQEEAKETVAKKVTGKKRGRKPKTATQFTSSSD